MKSRLAKLSIFSTKCAGESKEDYKSLLGNLTSSWQEAVLCVYSIYPSTESNNHFKQYILNTPEVKHRFEIWDTTCQLQTVIAKFHEKEFSFMGDLILQSLCKAALEKATHEIQIESEVVERAPYLLGGIAIWNLLLSKEDGGIFPNDNYNDFMTFIHQELTCDKKKLDLGTVDNMKQAFLDFKKYALLFQHIKPDVLKKLAELMIPQSRFTL